jgi:hypothetical protein
VARTADDQARIEVLARYSDSIGLHRIAMAVLLPNPIERAGEEWIVRRLRRAYAAERDDPEPSTTPVEPRSTTKGLNDE